MRKIAFLVLFAISLIGCNGDTETSVLSTPESTARYEYLGRALFALGSTVSGIDPSRPEIRITPTRTGDGYTLFVMVKKDDGYFDDYIVDVVPEVAPRFSIQWTDLDKERFMEIFNLVTIER